MYFRDDNWKRYGIACHRDDLTVDIFDGQWHHMVSVYDPTEILLEDRMIWYLDGTRQEVEVWIKGGIPSDFSFNVPMILAAQNFRGEIRGHFNGCLDEVAFYTTPLTAEEVMSHYQAATSADTDGDGIPDDQDQCVNSDLSPTVVIDACDSGVPNTLFPGGCTISDDITELADNSTSQGDFASAVAQYTNNLMKGGIIEGKQKGAIQSCAGQADSI